MFEKNVFLSGFSQGGTTLLLSLLDGQPDVLAYPDEPSLQRLFNRFPAYENSLHYLCDAIFGTPNPLGLGAEAGVPLDKRQKQKKPAIQEDEANDEMLADDKLNPLIKIKRLRGLENRLGSAEQHRFFQAYYEKFRNEAESCFDRGARAVRSHHFEALRAGTAALGLAHAAASVTVSKQPISKLSSVEKFDELVEYVRSHENGFLVFMVRERRALFYSRTQYYGKREGIGKIRLHRNPMAFFRLAQATKRDADMLDAIRAKYCLENDVIFINYEALVMRPSEVLAELCDFLGIGFDNASAVPSKLGFPAHLPTDRTGSSNLEVSQVSVDRWRSEMNVVEKVIAQALLQ